MINVIDIDEVYDKKIVKNVNNNENIESKERVSMIKTDVEYTNSKNNINDIDIMEKVKISK